MRRLGPFLALAALLLLPACAHAQGAALLQKPITAGNCATLALPNIVADSGVGCVGHQVTIDDGSGVHGSMILTPNVFGIGAAGIVNATSMKPVYFIKGVATTGTDAGDFKCYREANYTGGTFGFVNPCFYSYTTVSAGTTSFEWSLLARLDNNGTQADASQNVAAYFQARKLSTGSTWGAVTELYDVTANPATGSVTDEHDMTATGTDNNNARVLFDGWVRNVSGTAPVEAAYAIRLNTDTGGLWKHGIYFNGSYGDGINLSPGTYSTAAIALGGGQKLCFDGTTCANYISQPLAGTVTITAGGAPTATFNGFGENVLSLNATAGPVTVTSGNKVCLDSVTCGNYLSQAAGVISAYVGGGASPSLSINSVGIQTGGIAAVSLDASTRVSVPTNQKICLNGASCTIYLMFDGTSVGFFNSGSARFQVNMAAGTAGPSGALTSGISTGVNCSGAPTGAFSSSGGIVTHC